MLVPSSESHSWAARARLALLLGAMAGVGSPTVASAQAPGSPPPPDESSFEPTPEQRYGDWVRRLDFRPQEYAFRRSNMIRLLRESGGGMMIVPSSDGRTHGDTFRQLGDFWYYTGLEVPNSVLVLDADRDRSILFLPATDYRFENPGRPNDFPGRPLLDDFQLRSIAGIEEYRDASEFEDYLARRARGRATLRVNLGAPGAFEPPAVPFFGGLDPVTAMLVRIGQDHPEARIANAFEEVAMGRMVKSRFEVEKMRIAADATTQGIRDAAARIRPGIDERTLQGVFEETCRSRGAQT
ncbi:MAG: hypothetical protein HKO53_16900, partial [Gemmatimonadetes bacterium]|nr:hypothetical protein [Gemmatimonadota bacterium]